MSSILTEIRKSPRPTSVVREFHKRNEPDTEGSYRYVYFVDKKHVLKIAQTEWKGELCNKREARIWKKAQGTELEPLLAPVIDSGRSGKWLIMKRMNDLPYYFKYDKIQSFTDIVKKISREVLGSPIEDLFDRNICVNSKGELVVVDYGGFSG